MKKLLSFLLIGTLQLLAQANNKESEKSKFMGISNMPIKDSDSTQLLANAIEAKDFNFIQRWESEKGLKTPYTNKDVCYLEHLDKTYKLIPVTEALSDKSYQEASKNLAIGNRYPFFTKCENLPLISLLRSGVYFYSNPTYLKIIKKSVKEENKITQEWILKFMDKLDSNQWDMLIPIIVNVNLDYDVRKKALDMFVKMYPERKKTMSEHQTKFLENAKKYKVNSATATYANAYPFFDMAINPLFYIHKQAFFGVLKDTAELKKNTSLQALFSKDYFLGKKNSSIDDILSIKSNPGERAAALRIITAREIMNAISKMDGFDINFQDQLGDTIFHDVFQKKHGNLQTLYIADNRVLANWVRSYWENGANPLLLNNNQKSPYMLFEESRKIDGLKNNHTPLIESFTLKEYNN